MFKFFKVQDILRDVDDTSSILLGDETDKDIEDTEDKDTKDDDKDDDKTDDLEDDDLEKDEDKEDDKDDKEEDKKEELTSRPSYKDIKAKYPTIFKDFPELKQVYFREQAYSEVFTTVDEAKQAASTAESYGQLRDTVIKGDAKTLITQLNEVDKKGFSKFTENILPAIREVDEKAYYAITSPIIAKLLREVLSEGKSAGGDTGINIQKAAKVVHKVIFGGDYTDIDKEFKTESKTDKEDSDETKELKKKVEESEQKDYTRLFTEVSKEFDTKLEAEIDKRVPKEGMSEGIRKLIIKEIRDKIDRSMGADESHVSRMNALWKKEQRNGFSGANKDSIITTALSRAKSLVPKIAAEVKAENGISSKKENKEDDKEKLDTGAQGGKNSKLSMKEIREKGLDTKAVLFG